jgi:hypothetical protein
MSSIPSDPEGSRPTRAGRLCRRDLLKRAGALGVLASAFGALAGIEGRRQHEMLEYSPGGKIGNPAIASA